MLSKKNCKRHKYYDIGIVKILMVLLLIFQLSFIYAQESFVTSGGNASGSGGNSSYSIGQIVYTTITGIGASLNQGVQQPFEISIIEGAEEAKDVALSMSAYPNPTLGLLNLKVAAYPLDKLSYILSDVDGKILEFKEVLGNETIIEMKNYPNSIYFLKVVQEKNEVKLFKIIKN